jgi:hypothetical protein
MAQIVTCLEYQRTVPRWIPPAGPLPPTGIPAAWPLARKCSPNETVR